MGAAGNGTSLSGTLTLTVTPTHESDVVFDVYTSCAGGGQRAGRCGRDVTAAANARPRCTPTSSNAMGFVLA
jgi:hypothetical protein